MSAHRVEVVIVGAGFAGLGCARALAKHKDVHVIVVDRHDYHQFQPLLYQVATSQLARADVVFSLHELFLSHDNVEVVVGEVTAVDPASGRSPPPTAPLHRGRAGAGRRLAGAFFKTPAPRSTPSRSTPSNTPTGSGPDRRRLRRGAARPGLVNEGALTFVVVGAGATGTEIAGALAEMIRHAMPVEYPDLDVSAARVVMVDHGKAVLGPFSEHAHTYAASALERDGVELRLGTAVKEVGPGHALLSDDSRIATRTVIWGGGIAAAPLAAASGLHRPRGPGGVGPDLTVEGHPGVYVLGDLANIEGPDGDNLPQLGSVALQSGQWAAKNILAAAAGRDTKPFHYKDKGIMAMIGHNSAVAEVGKGRHEVDGTVPS